MMMFPRRFQRDFYRMIPIFRRKYSKVRVIKIDDERSVMQ